MSFILFKTQGHDAVAYGNIMPIAKPDVIDAVLYHPLMIHLSLPIYFQDISVHNGRKRLSLCGALLPTDKVIPMWHFALLAKQ